jgi:hypothetical protein
VVIHRGGGEMRVERDEQEMWIANGIGAAAVVVVAVLPVLSAKPPATYYVIPLAFLVAGAAFFVYLVRARDVCIIRPDRIGHGSVDGPIRWIPRDQVGSVELSRTPFFQLSFYDRNGKTLDSTKLRFFSDKELVEAFESAGIPVKAPRGLRHQARPPR